MSKPIDQLKRGILFNGARVPIHGLSTTPEYSAWKGMLKRCLDPCVRHYPDYGGRGIKVCERWQASLLDFITDVGKRPFPDASLGRINNDGNYEPGNVRWETRIQQMRNTRFNRIVSIGGVAKPVAAWVEDEGIGRKALYKRLKRNVTETELLAPRQKPKLTPTDVREIRRLRELGLKQREIAERFNVTQTNIGQLLRGITWRDVA